ncbi:MAG: hypothetical protein ACOX2M_05605 [Fastidiosipilaceae bacterium]|jgi:hypothetical protein
MKKVLFYAMTGEKMCFMHVLMNAIQLHNAGHSVSVIFEGASVKLPSVLEREENKLYLQAKEAGIIKGICFACSQVMEVLEANEATGLPMLKDMNGHAGMLDEINAGYEIISM